MDRPREATEVTIHGVALTCPVCQSQSFWHRRTLLNSRAATFFGVDWADRNADNYICSTCGYIYWFHKK